MNIIETLSAVLREENADAMLLTGEVNLMYVLKTVALEGQCLIFPDGVPVPAGFRNGPNSEACSERRPGSPV